MHLGTKCKVKVKCAISVALKKHAISLFELSAWDLNGSFTSNTGKSLGWDCERGLKTVICAILQIPLLEFWNGSTEYGHVWVRMCGSYLWTLRRVGWAECSPDCSPESHPITARCISGAGCRKAERGSASCAPCMVWTGCSLDLSTTTKQNSWYKKWNVNALRYSFSKCIFLWMNHTCMLFFNWPCTVSSKCHNWWNDRLFAHVCQTSPIIYSA